MTKLYKLKLEEDKNAYERLDKIENREIDQESKTAQMAESVKDRYFRFGMAAAELVLPLMFYGCLLYTSPSVLPPSSSPRRKSAPKLPKLMSDILI